MMPQTPCVDPGGALHGRPLQQSASVVHAPLAGTQVVPQTNAGPPSAALGFGTHGKPQQSELVEQG
jgi:hypothetical protein